VDRATDSVTSPVDGSTISDSSEPRKIVVRAESVEEERG